MKLLIVFTLLVIALSGAEHMKSVLICGWTEAAAAKCVSICSSQCDQSTWQGPRGGPADIEYTICPQPKNSSLITDFHQDCTEPIVTPADSSTWIYALVVPFVIVIGAVIVYLVYHCYIKKGGTYYVNEPAV